MSMEPQKRISTKALKVWRISGVISAGVSWGLGAAALFLLHIFEGPIWISVLIIIIEVLYTFLRVFIYPSLRWRQWRYEVRDEEIELQEGIFIRTCTLVPMVRVQHVDTVQGPLLRKYRLASVIVHTAATAHQIPALEESEAEELRAYISNLARVADEDV